MQLQNIPNELRALPQWVAAGPDKIPFNPRTGQPAKVNDRSTWGTFQDAVDTGMPYVGFVLTDSDPYVIIDLDDKVSDPATDEQRAFYAALIEQVDSYTERSASGRGYHIILRGRLEYGMRRDRVEVYSSVRYMICTGDVVSNKPINERQGVVDALKAKMYQAATTVELDEVDEILDDAAVLDMAMGAENADKFNMLCAGDISDYESQSEADFALLSMFTFYSPSNEQVRRLFRMTALGKREKAMKSDRYIDRSLKRIRAKQGSPISTSEVDEMIAAMQQASVSIDEAGEIDPVAFAALVPVPPPAPDSVNMSNARAPVVVTTTAPPPPKAKAPKPPGNTALDLVPAAYQFPHGLVGELAQYMYSSAIRPVPEVALAAGLALVAGIAARSYNVSNSGLHQYIVLLAKTGVGKEGARSGIESLISHARKQVPDADSFIGPAAFSSGQALVRHLDKTPCFISVLGEFGVTFQQLTDPRAPGHMQMLQKCILDLYSLSGHNKTLRPSVYSDTEKNTQLVQAPNVTLLGESVPERFYEGLSDDAVASGLLPRFSIIEYTGPRPPRNRNAFGPPPAELVDKLCNLLVIALTTAQNRTCCPVGETAEATAIFDELDVYCDGEINAANVTEASRNLWNRVHLKAQKLAALLAVGVDPQRPVITAAEARWAVEFTKHEVNNLLVRFSKGEVGKGDHRGEADLRRAITDYLRMPSEQREKYKVPKALAESALVPYHYLRRRLRLLSSFKDHRAGASLALGSLLTDLVKAEVLVMIPQAEAIARFNVKAALYAVGPSW